MQGEFGEFVQSFPGIEEGGTGLGLLGKGWKPEGCISVRDAEGELGDQSALCQDLCEMGAAQLGALDFE